MFYKLVLSLLVLFLFLFYCWFSLFICSSFSIFPFITVGKAGLVVTGITGYGLYSEYQHGKVKFYGLW